MKRIRDRSLRRWIAVFPLMAAGMPAAASGEAAHYTTADFATVAKFDAHVHINSSDTALIEQARADGFELLTINVDYPDFPAVAQQVAVAHQLAKRFPDRLHFATTISMRGWGAPGWAARTNAAIASALFVTEKAVAKHTNSIFTKLDLPIAEDDNRRVRAVLAYLKV